MVICRQVGDKAERGAGCLSLAVDKRHFAAVGCVKCYFASKCVGLALVQSAIRRASRQLKIILGSKWGRELETFLFFRNQKKKSFYNFKRKKTCSLRWFMTLFAVKLHKVQRFLSLSKEQVVIFIFFISFIIVGLDPTISRVIMKQIARSSRAMTWK